MKWEDVKAKVEDTEIIYSMETEAREKIFELVSGLKNGVYVEIGTAHGRTLYAVACAAKDNGTHCYGIDDLSLLPRNTDSEIRKLLEGLPATLIVGRSDTVPWDLPIDVLVIDGCHIASEVKKDYDKFLPFLKSGGYVVIDDWSDTGIDTDYMPSNAHWGIAYYGKLATKGWEEIVVEGIRAKIFKKP